MFTRAPAAVLLAWVFANSSNAQFRPDIESAVRNAPQIFNAVHGAMRQFSSSLHHNGMSFFQATIPAGTVLYHGSPRPDIPSSFEWLAFEVEHAENFANGLRMKRPNDGLPVALSRYEQKVLGPRAQTAHEARNGFDAPNTAPDLGIVSDDDWIQVPGYLQIYQAARSLNVLYIDGMAAGKTDMGTNDAEDYILSGNKSRTGMEDWPRVMDLCAWGKDWKIDGFIRMEPGFELVYCEFLDGGLNQVSVNRRPHMRLGTDLVRYQIFQWIQAAASRYHGIGGSRVLIDQSSMVSAFFYPLNLTNPNASCAGYPRLLSATESQLASIKHHIESMTPNRREKSSAGIDWQGITDMVVSRYANRLALTVAADSIYALNMSFNHLLDTYIHYTEENTDYDEAQKKCSEHYLAGIVPSTLRDNDKLIYAGISETLRIICGTLFKAHKIIRSDSGSNPVILNDTLSLVRGLMDQLSWSKWKECSACQVDEVCFIAMWPFGNTEDHYQPSCQNASTVFGRYGYWKWRLW